MPVVINSLKGGDTDTGTPTHTYMPTHEPKQFQETRLLAAHGWFKKFRNSFITYILVHVIILYIRISSVNQWYAMNVLRYY